MSGFEIWRCRFKTAVVAAVGLVLAGAGAAFGQPEIFADGFEDGTVCRWSNATSLHELCGVPHFPGIVLVSAIGTSEAALSWLPGEDEETPASQLLYQVHADRTDGFQPTSATRLAAVRGDLQTQVNGLEAGATYYLLVIAVDADGKQSPERDYRSLAMPAEPTETTAALVQTMDELHLGRLTAEDDGSLTFRRTPSSIPPLPGAILVGQNRDLVFTGDLGYLRRVVGVTSTPDSFVVATEDASLQDVFSSAGLSSTIAMSGLTGQEVRRLARNAGDAPIEALHLPLDAGASYSRVTWNDGPLLAMDQLDYVTRGADGDYYFDYGPFDLSLSFDFEPELRVASGWSLLGGIEHGEVVARGNLSLQAESHFSTPEFFRMENGVYLPLVRRSWLFVHRIGRVPVLQRVVFTLSYRVVAVLGAGLQASASAEAELEATLGVMYDPSTGSWNDVGGFESETSGQVSIGGVSSLRLGVSLVPQFEVRTYEALSTRFAVEPELDLDVLLNFTGDGPEVREIDFDLVVECGLSSDLTVFHRLYEILPRTTVCGPYVWHLYSFLP